MSMAAALVAVASAGFWQSSATPTPVVSVPIAPLGEMFAAWQDGDGAGVGVGVGDDMACNWWNGTHHYDTPVCDSFSVTRLSTGIVQAAIDRANRCAAVATTDCVLNGEIGFAVPSVFIYDKTEVSMRMLVAPRFLEIETDRKTIKMQDPEGLHPNQLFDFNTSVRVEYLKGGSRTLETETLTGADAYCLQTLRRSIVPACWATLD